MGAVFVFPGPMVRDVCCPFCRRAVALHRLNGRGLACVQDVAIGRDQQTAARRARLVTLQRRVSTVDPWGVDGEGFAGIPPV